jgi:hypothetical protein
MYPNQTTTFFDLSAKSVSGPVANFYWNSEIRSNLCPARTNLVSNSVIEIEYGSSSSTVQIQ